MSVVSRIRPKDTYSGLVPEGLHRARLAGAKAFQTKKNSGVELEFVTADGDTLKEQLYDSAAAQKRMVVIAKRMGAGFGDADEEAEVDWEKFAGREYVLKIQHQDFQGQKSARLTYAGIWPLDHEDKEVRDFLTTPAGQRAPAEAAHHHTPAPVDVSDI